MQLPSLKYFAAVARSGSLRHAAEVFDIAPSAISRQIALLESRLAVTLFERSSRGMTLTDIKLLEKHGGKSGSFINTASSHHVNA